MKWFETTSNVIVDGNQESVWEKLIKALGLPSTLNLPFYENSKNINQDRIYQNMRLEVISVVTGKPIPITLSAWLPEQNRLAFTFHKSNDPNLTPIEIYKFYVNETPDKNKSQIYFVASMPKSILSAVNRVFEYFDGEPLWANSVLRNVVRELR